MEHRKQSKSWLLSICLSVALGGCVTTNGGGSGQPKFDALGDISDVASSLGDALSPQLRELKKLVNESRLSEADAYFNKESVYFRTRYLIEKKPIPSEVKTLAEYVWQTRFQSKTQLSMQQLIAVNSVSDKSKWNMYSQSLRAANIVSEAASNDLPLEITRVGESEVLKLKTEIVRVTQLVRTQKSIALEATFDNTLMSGKHERTYIGGESFRENDYVNSAAFQALALKKISESNEADSYFKEAIKLSSYLNANSKKIIDQEYIQKFSQEILVDKQVTLEEVVILGKARTPFGSNAEALHSLVSIGYVDLTSASFKNRNIFDFEIAFKQDLDVNLKPATEDIFSNGEISKFDFLFVTDLNTAKVSREFKSKKDNRSRVQTGTRPVQNPAYITALAEYQKAMSEFQQANIRSAIPQTCSGYSCGILSFSNALAEGNAKRKVDAASSVLSSTRQTIDEPVFSSYNYQKVSISTTKSADVNYYVIDLKKRRILQNSFQINNNEVFDVAYNVEERDPDKSSIYRNVKSEEDVTAWEKRPITVPVSALFSADNLSRAEATIFSDVGTFLKKINSKKYASSGSSYTKRAESEIQRKSTESKGHGQSDQTIADERYDSVVIIRNAKALGTGFYITPELVLTAYHVVEGSSLVEMTYYDGTKTYGRVVDHDIRLDLALIKAQQAGKPLPIFSGPIKLGETVEAIGHPKGYEFTITRGVISAVRRQRSAFIDSNNLVEFIQTDTPISPGNSGGPLLLKNSVIGVNDWIRVDKGAQNLNFSVSYNEIRAYLDRFKAK